VGKTTQHKNNRWNRNLFALIFVLLIGCSQVNDLPLTPEAAFGVPDVPRNARTFMRTFVVKATMSDAMRAADEALAAINFKERPDGSTNERRCGHRVTGWYDWAVWGCFYFVPGSESETIKGRVVTELWRTFGLSTRQEWDLLLTSAFQRRLRAIQEGTR